MCINIWCMNVVVLYMYPVVLFLYHDDLPFFVPTCLALLFAHVWIYLSGFTCCCFICRSCLNMWCCFFQNYWTYIAICFICMSSPKNSVYQSNCLVHLSCLSRLYSVFLPIFCILFILHTLVSYSLYLSCLVHLSNVMGNMLLVLSFY